MFGLIILGGIISLVSVLTYVKITLWSVHRSLISDYPLVLFYIIHDVGFFRRRAVWALLNGTVVIMVFYFRFHSLQAVCPLERQDLLPPVHDTFRSVLFNNS
jgi:hypothetical protein